jgi:hypothetical protein
MKTIKQLSKQVSKEYWANKQHLLISTIEVLDYNPIQYGEFCVYTIDPKTEEFKTYLFDVQNYNAFFDTVYPIDVNTKYQKKYEWKLRFDSDRASCVPFYDARKRVYTIPKFERITREDILTCFKHFKKQLDCWGLFNVSWHEFKEGKYIKGEEQYELDFSKEN